MLTGGFYAEVTWRTTPDRSGEKRLSFRSRIRLIQSLKRDCPQRPYEGRTRFNTTRMETLSCLGASAWSRPTWTERQIDVPCLAAVPGSVENNYNLVEPGSATDRQEPPLPADFPYAHLGGW